MVVQDPVREPGADRAVFLSPAGYDGLPEVVARILGRFPLPLRGARVLVKPNMLGPYPPGRGVTTHPSLVAAVVDALLAMGARPVVGDNPGARGYGITRECGEVTEIREASRGCFVNLGERPVDVRIQSPFTDRVRVSREVIEADLVVNLPKMKTHVQTTVTAGIKNTYGYLVGAEKSRLHALAPASPDFGRLLADVFFIRPPELTIVDAVTVMEGDGPSSGKLRHVGLVVAATDAAAADMVVCRLMGIDPGRVHHLAEVRRRLPGAGEYDAVGPAAPAPLPDFRLPVSFVHGVKSYLANRLLFSFLTKSRLRARPDRCNGCGTCVDSCPTRAMRLEGGVPRIDREGCIACYCCHELCPVGAIELNPILRRMLRDDRR